MFRTPVFLQAQPTECCIAVLGAMLGYHGRTVTLAELRAVTGISRDCLSAGDMVRAARHYGLDARVLRKEPATLAQAGLPLIVHLDFVHFAVLEEIGASSVQLNDPGMGHVRIPREVFDERFTGIAITLAPTPQFERNAPPPGVLRACLDQLAPDARGPLARMALAAGLAALAPAALACYLAGAASPLAAGSAAVLAAAARLLARRMQLGASDAARNAIGAAGERRFVECMASQPQAYFDYRIPAALQEAARLPHAAAATLCLRVLPALVQAAEAALLLGVLAWLAPGIGAAAAGIAGASVLLVHLAGRRGGWRLRALLADPVPQADSAGGSDEAARTGGQEEQLLAAGAGALADGIGQRQWLARWSLQVGMIQGACLLALVALLAHAAGAGGAVQRVALLLLAAPVPLALRALSRLPAHLQELHMQLQLLGDALAPVAAAAPRTGGLQDPGLVARDLVFGYATGRAPLLDGASLAVRPGEIVGLTGASGAGKSTLASLLAGLGAPWSGTACVDGRACAALAPAERARTVAWVGKFPVFFPGSVRANLALWDDALADGALLAALDDACAGALVAGRPGGLDAAVAPRASNFSGGQRQRLAIARALARGPRVLILDEATDGLDRATEAELLARLRARGCAVILVSHRPESLAACDRVLLLDAGAIRPYGSGAAPVPPAGAPEVHVGQAAPDAPAVPLPDPVMLRDCLRRLATSAGLPWRSHAPAPGPASTRARLVRALASAHGLRLRPVRMVARRWWRADPGALLVFERGSGQPVLLRGPAAPDRFEEEAYAALHPAGHQEPASLDALLRKHAGVAWVWTIAASVVDGALATAALCAAVLWPWPHALALGAASLSWHWAAGRQVARAAARAHAALDGALAAVDAAAVHTPSARRRADGAGAASDLLRPLRDDRRGRPSAAAAAGALLAALAALGVLRPAAWPGWLALAAAAFMPLAWMPPRAALLRHGHARRRRAAFLHHALHFIDALRAAGRADAALRRWLAMAGRHGRAWERGGAAWRDALPLAAVGLLAAFLLARPGVANAQHGLALAALVLALLASAASLCQAAQAWAAALDRRRAAQLLLRAPRDPAPAAPPAHAPHLSARGISFTWPGSQAAALDGVSLELAPGRITALAGPSGSGKSTLLRILLGFALPARGQLLVDGMPASGAGLGALRQATGLVMQDQQLDGAGTLRWHLDPAAAAPLEELWQALALAGLDGDVRAMPMGVLAIVDSARLATGQLQRLLIARCLLRRPRLLVLDEATSAMPDEVQATLLERIRALGITCLLVSHRASALACADEIVVLEHGRVAARGAPADAAVKAALGMPLARQAVAPPAPVTPAPPPVRAGLFREQALRQFRGARSGAMPLLLLRRATWAGAAALLLAAAALAARVAS